MGRFQLAFCYLYSFFIALRYLTLKEALRHQLLIHPCVKIKELHRGSIILSNAQAKLIFGFNGTLGQSNCQSIIFIERGSHLVLYGLTTMAKGTRLIIDGGQLEIGQRFFCNGDCFIRSNQRICLGNDNLFGWNVTLNTTVGHAVSHAGVEKKQEGDINIGNHVWVGAHATIGKNVDIAHDCVIGQHSVVTRSCKDPHCLIAGTPAKVVATEYSWRE